MLPELVAMPMPNEMVTECPYVILLPLPLFVTAPLLELPSPEARVKVSSLLINDNSERIDASPPAAPNKLPAVTQIGAAFIKKLARSKK